MENENFKGKDGKISEPFWCNHPIESIETVSVQKCLLCGTEWINKKKEKEKMKLEKTTIGYSDGGETLYLWETKEEAQNIVDASPVDDGALYTLTYHRFATEEEVNKLLYSLHGTKIAMGKYPM